MELEIRYQNNLDDQEARTVYLVVKDSLCEEPFAMTMLVYSNQ